ncbi:hypothetical protein [Arhodomonas sp. AD133]|uniref:hypothetical protein n=1 Tax=Arhodomonas sp. AD133 TaxID=3415009 RepID=UPI003EB767FB
MVNDRHEQKVFRFFSGLKIVVFVLVLSVVFYWVYVYASALVGTGLLVLVSEFYFAGVFYLIEFLVSITAALIVGLPLGVIFRSGVAPRVALAASLSIGWLVAKNWGVLLFYHWVSYLLFAVFVTLFSVLGGRVAGNRNISS